MLTLGKTAGFIQCNRKEAKNRLLDFVVRAYGHFLCIFPVFLEKKEICSSADIRKKRRCFKVRGREEIGKWMCKIQGEYAD